MLFQGTILLENYLIFAKKVFEVGFISTISTSSSSSALNALFVSILLMLFCKQEKLYLEESSKNSIKVVFIFLPFETKSQAFIDFSLFFSSRETILHLRKLISLLCVFKVCCFNRASLFYFKLMIFPLFFFYYSIDKVPKVASPVLVIHGTEDEVIDFSHGLAIYDKCPRAVEPLWVEVCCNVIK